MKLDIFFLLSVPLSEVAGYAKAAEMAGFDGLWMAETQHDPFLSCALIGANTDKCSVDPV